MKIQFGSGNSMEQSVRSVFGQSEVSLPEVLAHYSDLLGFDSERVDVAIDGCVVRDPAGTIVTDAGVLVLTPKANTKG